MNTERFKGAASLFGAALIYSTFGLLVRVMSEMFGDYSQVAARMALAFLIILGINFIFKRIKPLTKKQVLNALFLGALFAGVLVFFTISVTQTKIANSVFLLYAASMSTSLILGTILFKEKLGMQKIVALVLHFAGLFMYADFIVAFSFGIIAAILSGVFEGVANAVRKSLQGVDRPTVLQYQFFGAAVVSTLVMLLMPNPVIMQISLWPLVALVVFALLQVKLGDLLLYGFQHFDVNIGTVILATEIFFAALVGFIFFHEVLAVKEIIGGLLIFVASIVTTFEFKPKLQS